MKHEVTVKLKRGKEWTGAALTEMGVRKSKQGTVPAHLEHCAADYSHETRREMEPETTVYEKCLPGRMAIPPDNIVGGQERQTIWGGGVGVLNKNFKNQKNLRIFLRTLAVQYVYC